jgi:hypothetical protein
MKKLSTILAGLIWVSTGGAGQQASSNAKWRSIQMFSVQQDGVLREIAMETAAIDQEKSTYFSRSMAGIVDVARLPGGKASLRYSQRQAIKILAHLPPSVDPRQLALFAFETKGPVRITYLGRFWRKSPDHWNTYSFHAQPLTDGSWLLEPNQLAIGEYCFSPKFSNQNYCFGVDN